MNRSLVWHLLAGWLMLVIFAVALFPHPDMAVQADIPRQGEVSARAYVAPITFEVPKSTDQLQHEREAEEAKVDAVFEYNADATARILADFHLAMREIARYGLLRTRLSQTTVPAEAALLRQQADALEKTLSQRLSSTAIHHLSQHAGARDTLTLEFERLVYTGVSDVLLASTPRQIALYKEYHNLGNFKSLLYAKPTVTLLRDNREMTVEISKIRPREAVVEDAFADIQASAANFQGLQSAFYEVLHAYTEPNIFYLDKETQERREEAAARVNPITGIVPKGVKILAPGNIVTQDAVDKLMALHVALQQEEGRRSMLTTGFGQALFLLLIAVLFVIAMSFLRGKDWTHPRHFWAVLSAHILQIIAFWIVESLSLDLHQSSFFPDGTDFIWLQPFVLAPALCTVLFNFRIGILSAAFVSIHMGMQSSYDLAVFLGTFLSTLAAVAFLHQIRYRSHFILSSIAGALVLIFSQMIILLLRNRLGWLDFWPGLLLGSVQILLTVSVTSFLLVNVFERIFGITTSLRLMELSDFNNPALKLLSERAPGSFHHSIMVGNLAEKAATRIGADPLLTRVVALYHDIGKSENPEYFTENQKRGENPHDALDPRKSVEIIRRHVAAGLKIAKDYRLPERVAAGIPEHHGNNVIHYFYKKALQQGVAQESDIDDFRYPGPLPQTRDSALVMLADGIEATSRSMEDPDAASLSKLVQDVIQTRLQENQLHDSGLSIQDLEEVEIGFLQSLEGMYHTRIQYPEGVFITKRSLLPPPKSA
ncbi:MAG TPA: HDIG domain-containing protein [Fibrobacteraceae bacterium]|nr:HDIG domain-containing protein [Fibrobacteraceae bacterium]